MRTFNIYSIFILLILISFSCADLDDPQPINSTASEFAIVDRASAKAALNGVYSDLQDATLVFDGWLGLPQYFSDECNFSGTFPTRLEFANFEVFPANTTMAAVFSDFYEIINRANNVIALVPVVSDDAFTAAERDDVIGQARFIRAQVYLFMVALWQDVPLILNPTIDVGEVLFVPTSPVAEIYAQIEADFGFAQTAVTSPTSVFEASQQSANAFLARASLYQGNHADALSRASAVLDGIDLTTVPYLEDQIYSLNFTPTDGNNIAFFYGPAALDGRYSINPSFELFDSFEDGDIRRAATIDTLGGALYGVKYPSFADASAGSSTDPIFFIRHSEVALIAAESAAQLGDFASASAYINMVRTRAGLGDITLDADNWVDAILQERFVELAMEGAHRLNDLRRLGRAEAVLGPLGYDACDSVWPLPQREIDRNVNLTQNDCCNC